MIVSIIAAVGKNGVIGSKNSLPWRLPTDLKRFKNLTMGHPIIMGRKTFESIGRVLPGRRNIVVSNNSNIISSYPDLCVVESIPAAINLALDVDEVFIIGGASIYEQAIKMADRLYITSVDAEPDGDTFFPLIDLSHWKEVSREDVPKAEGDEYPVSFLIFERKSA